MAKGLGILPDNTNASTMQRVASMWDSSSGFPLPMWDVQCPVCRAYDVQGRRWTFFTRGEVGERNPYRCDIDFKCRECSCVWKHGVMIDQELFERHVSQKDGSIVRIYDYHGVKQIIEGKEIAKSVEVVAFSELPLETARALAETMGQGNQSQ